jgi:hypothetical protein
MGWSDPTSLPPEPWRSLQPSEQDDSLFTMCFARVHLGQKETRKEKSCRSLISHQKMVKREYELQEPIAVAVDKDATFIQSTADHVVNSALKIVIGDMWSSAAGTGLRKRAELSLAVGEAHQSASKCPQKHRAGWSFRNETFSRASRSWAPYL